MTPVATVLLFDVDGTLVRTGGAGSRALRRAFLDVHGDADAVARVDVRGNTDGSIVKEALRALGEPPSEAAVERVLARYLEALEEEVASSPGYEVLPGVDACLRALHGLPGFAVGLGTGNVARGARVKLARGGLDRYFGFGGYGCDSEHRPTLVRRGADRGIAALAPLSAAPRVVVIGDTPRDVHAARENGFDVLAVATGGHPLDELHETGADRVVASLEDASALAFLRGDAPRR